MKHKSKTFTAKGRSLNNPVKINSQNNSSGKMLNNNQRVVWGVLAVLLIVALGAAVYFYVQLNQLREDPQKVAQVEAKSLVTKVGKLIVLPEGEEPTVATVTDPNLLRDQPFFANAKTGDKVLIYTNARKAILYNPEENKIIEVAPVSIGATQPTPPVGPTATSPTTGQQPQ